MQRGSKQTEEAKKLQAIGTRRAHARRKGIEPSVEPDEGSLQEYKMDARNERRAQRRLEKKMIEDALAKLGLRK